MKKPFSDIFKCPRGENIDVNLIFCPFFLVSLFFWLTISGVSFSLDQTLIPSVDEWVRVWVSKKAFVSSGPWRINLNPDASSLKLSITAGTELFGGRIGESFEGIGGKVPVAGARITVLFPATGTTMEFFSDSRGEVAIELEGGGQPESTLLALSLDGEITRGFVSAVHELDNCGYPLFPMAAALMKSYLRMVSSGDPETVTLSIENLTILESMLNWIFGCEERLVEAAGSFSSGISGLLKSLEEVRTFFQRASGFFSSIEILDMDRPVENAQFQKIFPYVAQEILSRNFDLFRLLSRNPRTLFTRYSMGRLYLESAADLLCFRSFEILGGHTAQRASTDFADDLRSNFRSIAMDTISRAMKGGEAGIVLTLGELPKPSSDDNSGALFSPSWSSAWPGVPDWTLDRTSAGNGPVLLRDTLNWFSECCHEAVEKSGNSVVQGSLPGPFEQPLIRLDELSLSIGLASDSKVIHRSQFPGIQNGNDLQSSDTDHLPPYLERVVEYAKFGIYRKLDKELSESLEKYRSRIELLIKDGLDERSEGFWRSTVMAYGELSSVRTIVMGLALTSREGLTQNVSQSFDMSLKTYLEMKAMESDCVLALVSDSGADHGAQKSVPYPLSLNLKKKFTALESKARELSLHLGEAFAKIVIENVTIPGTIVISQTGWGSSGKNMDETGKIEIEVRNIGMEAVEGITVTAHDDRFVKIGDPITRSIDKLGANESRRIFFDCRVLQFPPFGIASILGDVRIGARATTGFLAFHRVNDQRPPVIQMLNPMEGTISEPDNFRVRAIFTDSESGIDPSSFKAVLNGSSFGGMSNHNFGLTTEVTFPVKLRRSNFLELSCSDRSGNLSQVRIPFRGRVVNWPLVIFIGLFTCTLLWIWLTAFSQGEWSCQDCSFMNSWWDPSCAHCERERSGGTVRKRALSIMAWMLRALFRIWESFLWTSKEARKKVFVQFHRQRLSRHLSEMGSALYEQKGIWLDELLDPSTAEKFSDYTAVRERLEEIEAFAATLKARGESGDLMSAEPGGLLAIAEELQGAEDEIHELSRRKRRIQMELGEWIYTLCKGGARVPMHFQEASSEAFNIEKAMTESAQIPFETQNIRNGHSAIVGTNDRGNLNRCVEGPVNWNVNDPGFPGRNG